MPTRHLILTTAALYLTLISATCDSDGDALTEGPGAFSADYKTSEAFFTLMAGPHDGNSPHGVSQIWYSANIRPLVGETSFQVPVGTVAIKEFDMMGDGTEVGLAVMIKREFGFDADNGDWYYDMRDLAGNVMADPEPGAIPMCVGCHTAAAGMDYLPGFSLR